MRSASTSGDGFRAAAMISPTSVNSAAPKPRVASSRRADAQSRGDHRRARVERDGVAVDRDADGVQDVLRLLAVEGGVAEVHEDEVDVGPAGEDRDAVLGDVGPGEALGDDAGPLEDALLAFLELG